MVRALDLDLVPTLEELAVIADLSPSTLTRYLSAQDCNFRQLALGIRHERARVMLRDHGMRVSDVAQALGYTTVGNFIRAFKAQEGVSPTQFTAGAGRVSAARVSEGSDGDGDDGSGESRAHPHAMPMPT